MRILLTGGGTAGHTNPALAIAEYIRANDQNAEIMFVGRHGGEENKAVTDAGFELREIEICGLLRRLSLENVKRIAIALRAVRSAKEIIRGFKPDAVVGTGGYVAFPCLWAASALGVPVLVHESNATPGIVTKVVAGKCDRVLINLDGTRKHLRRQTNVVTVGNPLRMDFERIGRRSARQRLGIRPNELFILSFGGSGGSEKMNEACIALMKSYSLHNPSIRHIHATGSRYYERYKRNEPELCKGKNGCRILRYIDNMPALLNACDLAIARCGALTLSELSCSGTPAILIPSPNVTDNHQYKNALYFKENSASLLLEEDELSERSLTDCVREMIDNEEVRHGMAKSIRKLYTPGSADKIYKEIQKCVGGN